VQLRLQPLHLVEARLHGLASGAFAAGEAGAEFGKGKAV